MESLRPSYNFVQNNPVDGIDKTGLDRWLIHGIHSAVVVEVWDECCVDVVGYKRIDFGPASGWAVLTLGLVWPGQVTITDVSKPSGMERVALQQRLRGRQHVVELGAERTKAPTALQRPLFNCNDFAEEALMMGATVGFPSYGRTAWEAGNWDQSIAMTQWVSPAFS